MYIMHPVRRATIALASTLASLLVLGACAVNPAADIAPPAGTVLDLGGAAPSEIVPADLAKAVRSSDVAVLGEIHDNAGHHRVQAWLAAQMGADALVFEMIPEALEPKLAAYDGDPAGLGPAIGWDDLGWPDWAIYSPIVAAVPDAAIYGAALPRKTVRASVGQGAAAVTPHDRQKAILQQPLAASVQAKLVQEMIDSHCGAIPAEMAPGMAEAQRLRDAALAEAVLRARDAGAKRIAVITGNGHTRTDRGVAWYLAEILPELRLVSIGQSNGNPSDVSGGLYDYAWVGPSQPPGPDPCDAFKKKS